MSDARRQLRVRAARGVRAAAAGRRRAAARAGRRRGRADPRAGARRGPRRGTRGRARGRPRRDRRRCAALAAALADVESLRERDRRAVEHDAIELALALAEKILAGACEARPSSSSMSSRARCAGSTTVAGSTVLVNPADLETVRAAIGDAALRGRRARASATCRPTSGSAGRRDRAHRRGRGRRERRRRSSSAHARSSPPSSRPASLAVSDGAPRRAAAARRAREAVREADLARRHGLRQQPDRADHRGHRPAGRGRRGVPRRHRPQPRRRSPPRSSASARAARC